LCLRSRQRSAKTGGIKNGVSLDSTGDQTAENCPHELSGWTSDSRTIQWVAVWLDFRETAAGDGRLAQTKSIGISKEPCWRAGNWQLHVRQYAESMEANP
jgi:hypothetical protein